MLFLGPFIEDVCLRTFEDGVKAAGAEESLKPKDIAEMLTGRL
jgi:hypothetical protein